MKRHCGDFRSVELENVREAGMQGNEEDVQDLNQPDRVVGAVVGLRGFRWLL